MKKLEDSFLNPQHQASEEAVAKALAKQSPMSSGKFIAQAKGLASRSQQAKKNDSNNTGPYVPSKNSNSEVA